MHFTTGFFSFPSKASSSWPVLVNPFIKALKRLSNTIKAWFNPTTAVMDTITSLLQVNTDNVVNANPEATIEQRTAISNYDLIAWDYVSEMKNEK